MFFNYHTEKSVLPFIWFTVPRFQSAGNNFKKFINISSIFLTCVLRNINWTCFWLLMLLQRMVRQMQVDLMRIIIWIRYNRTGMVYCKKESGYNNLLYLNLIMLVSIRSVTRGGQEALLLASSFTFLQNMPSMANFSFSAIFRIYFMKILYEAIFPLTSLLQAIHFKIFSSFW